MSRESSILILRVEGEEGAEAPKKEEGKKAKGKKEEKGPVAGVLGFPAEIAPYKVVVLPLDMRVAAQYGAQNKGKNVEMAPAMAPAAAPPGWVQRVLSSSSASKLL